MNNLRSLLFILILFYSCNSSDNKKEDQGKRQNEFIWIGARANFYENDSLNIIRGHLFLPTIYFDFQYKNMSKDTVKIVLGDDCSIYVENNKKVEKSKYCLTGFSVADTVLIYPNKNENFSYTLPFFEEGENTPPQVMNDILQYGFVFHITDSNVYSLQKAQKFKVEYREPDDTGIE